MVNGVVSDTRGRDVPAPGRFRQEFRRYLSALPDADKWRSASVTTAEEGLTRDALFMALLNRDGWNRVGWPEQAGGLGGTEIHRAIYYEELGHAHLPIPAQQWTLETLGPTLLRFAPRLASEHLPRYLDGTEWWGQCFSEPEAGSDLAGLRTRAIDDGDNGLVINGQKTWTSQGGTATRLLTLVRTGNPESRHRGLTMVLIDANTPGVTVRPIALASGRRELAEVFFDDVRVPPERVVGTIDDGWAVAMFLMQFERGMYGYAMLNHTMSELGKLRSEMAEHGSSPSERERFARVYVDLVAARARTATTVRKIAAGTAVGPDSSIDKLLFATAEQAVNDLILDVRREWMVTGTGGGSTAALSEARAAWWYSRASTIMGGTAEIQRGIIADHILGLPREKR
ncbi:MAG: acyl-CoA dehydrogenase family protein [Mycobacterium sp.]|jgi:acyl-CoA dehydrogenase